MGTERGGTGMLPAVHTGSRRTGDGENAAARGSMPATMPGWRAGMVKQFSRDSDEAGQSPIRRPPVARSAGRTATLTPLRRAGHPRGEHAAGRRSKSAEPGLWPHAPAPHGHGWDKGREATAGSSRLVSTTSLAAADWERPVTRTKVLPLVPNRADAGQVAAFYSELREAVDAGKSRFENGIDERTQQRLANQKRRFTVRVVGSETVEPLTHPEFVIAVHKLLDEISAVDDEYDSDEAEEVRLELFERTRHSWHFARAMPPEHAKTAQHQLQIPEHPPPKTPEHSKPKSKKHRRHGHAHSPSGDEHGVEHLLHEVEAAEVLLLHHPPPAADGKPPLERQERFGPNTASGELHVDIHAVHHHNEQVAGFLTLGVESNPKLVDLQKRTDLVTPKMLEAMAGLFGEVKGLKSPDTLLLSQCYFGGVGLDAMAPYLKKCFTIKRLELNENNLCSRSATTLAGVLHSLTRLVMLKVDNNELCPRGVKAIMGELRGAESLRGISMHKCELADEGAHYVSQALHPAYWNTSKRDDLVVERRRSLMHPHLNAHAQGAGTPNFFLGTALTSLNLSDNMIGPTGAAWLLDSLASFGTNLKLLDLSLNQITDAGQDMRGARALCEALKTCTNLETLNLNDCKLHVEGAYLLVEGLMDKTKQLQHGIKELWSLIGKSSSENVATKEALEREVEKREKDFRNYIMTRPLHTLLLARNNFGVFGMKALGEARNLYPSLHELDISSNEVTGNSLNFSFDAALVVCASAKSARHMKHISFRDNRMGMQDPDAQTTQPALDALCSALAKLSGLVRVDLANNLIGQTGVRQLAAALDVLRHLIFLDLSSNALGSDGIKTIVAAFRPALEDLNLADNDIGPDGTSALATRVHALTNLTRLDLSRNRLTQALAATRRQGGSFVGSFKLKDVAKEVGVFGEARKQLLMAGGDSTKRGLPALGAACAQHLPRLESMIIYQNIEVGLVRTSKPTLNLSGADFHLEDITVLFQILACNKEVTAVDLSHNDLEMGGVAIAEWLKEATQLQELNLSHARLQDPVAEKIGAGCKNLINLTTLILSNNNIGVDGLKVLSQAIQSLHSLRTLDLSSNPLTHRHEGHTSGENYYSAGVAALSESLATCEKLQDLDLSKCFLGDDGAVAIADCLQYLSDLRTINLVENSIEETGQGVLSKALRQCRALTHADTITAQEVKAGQHLTIASIYQVTFVANCMRRDFISKIDMSNNRLGRNEDPLCDLCEGLGRLQNLTDLNLSGNKPFSRKVSQTLAHSLKPMTSLRSLKIADNEISGDGADAILCTLVNLFQIEVLDLSKNGFTTFPIGLSISCPILWKMELGDNPWKCPVPSLMAKNTTQIREELNLEFLNGTIDREMALIFIGKTEVGKSRVIDALMDEENKSKHIAFDARTHGIQLHAWKPHNSRGSPFYNIYDFAGLDIYRPMQFNMCLLRRAIYCVVWRPFRRMRPEELEKYAAGDKTTRVDLETPVYRVGGRGLCTWDEMEPYLLEQATSWIDKLYRRVPGFSILLISTHSDCVDNEDVLKQSQAVKQAVETQIAGLRERFSYLPAPSLLNGGNSVSVSAKTGANMDLLKETLLRETYSLPYWGEILPHSWMKARHVIAQTRNMHRAVLRHRKKEATHEDAHPLLDAGALGEASTGIAALADPLSDSEDNALEGDADGVDVPTERSMAKIWHCFASRCNLRMRLKKMVAITPDMAKGSMWIGHFKNLINKAGIDSTQTYAVMRYFHDSGWIRCFGFDDSKISKIRSNEYDAGFELLDPYRSGGFRQATNSPFVMHRKDAKPPDRPADIHEEPWIDMCETVFLDMQWLFHMTHAFLNHDGTELMQQANTQLQREAMQLYSTGELKWSPGTPALISKLWREFLHEHEFRRIRHVLQAKHLLEYSSRNMLVVPGLRKIQDRAERVIRMQSDQVNPAALNPTEPPAKLLMHGGLSTGPQMDGESSDIVACDCKVFISREYSSESIVTSQDINYGHYLLPLLRHVVSQGSCAEVLDCAGYQTDDEIDIAMSSSTALVLCVSDTHMRSKAGQKHIFAALNRGLHIIAVILPGYSVWPPSLKDCCWWDFDSSAVVQSLALAALVDLSPSYFHVYFDILIRLQDADTDGEIEPHEAEEMWNNLRMGEYDEDDPALHDETAILSASMQLSKNSLLQHRKWVLGTFIHTLEAVGRRVSQLFYRKRLFLPELCEEELEPKRTTTRRIIKRHEEAMARMNDIRVREEEVYEEVRQARLADEATKQRQAEEEQRRMKNMADQWQSDPLHAKLAMLKDIANIAPGLGALPRWEHKQHLLDTAQEMAQQIRADEEKARAGQEHDGQPAAQEDMQRDEQGIALEDANGREQESLASALDEVEKLDEQLGELAEDAAKLADGGTSLDSSLHSPATSVRPPETLPKISSSLSISSSAHAPLEQEPEDVEITDPFFHLVGPAPGPAGAGATDGANELRFGHSPARVPAGRIAADPFLGEALMQEQLIGTALGRGLTLGSLQAKAGPLIPPGPATEEQRKAGDVIQEEK